MVPRAQPVRILQEWQRPTTVPVCKVYCETLQLKRGGQAPALHGNLVALSFAVCGEVSNRLHDRPPFVLSLSKYVRCVDGRG